MSEFSLFDDLSRPSKADDKALVEKSKAKSKKMPVTIRGNGLSDKIRIIRQFVEEHLGKYKDKYICIQDMDLLHDYVDVCLRDGRISLDTETTGLNVFRDKIVGISLDSKSNKSAYIPINHVSYNMLDNTFTRIDTQLTEEQVRKELERLAKVQECDMFNAPFDRRVIRHNIGIDFPCTWDSSIGMHILNENLAEDEYKLKPLHARYVLDGAEDEFSYGEIFNDTGFDKMPIDIATLYAAHDADITTEFSDWQRQFIFYEEDKSFEDRNGMNGASWCFFNIEMPCIDATIEMEENGITLNMETNRKLSEKYNARKAELLDKFYKELEPYEDELEKFRREGVKIDRPLNVNSTKQLAVLIYDVLKCPVVDKKSPRSTAEATLLKFDEPILKTLLEYRGVEKLIGTYIDKMPNLVEADGKIHGGFNQYGTVTGRYSSKKPNMQNIPSHNKDIRPMFTASEGCMLMSSDYSQQEPSCLASFCKEMGYEALFNARFRGDDLYSTVASAIFNLPYDVCCEFDKDGNKNPPEYKERRTNAKPVLLGILYDRGDESVAEEMKITLAEAQHLKQNLYRDYPEILAFEEESVQMARDKGYVTTICGRKRRLPEMMLDQYEFKWVEPEKHTDALDFGDNSVTEVPDDLCDYYWDKLMRCDYRGKRKIFEEANKRHGIWIVDNTRKIEDTTRQCVNSRIQGSAADLTKLAMIEILKNEKLTKLGFKLLLAIHDEVIGECPKENVEECSKLLTETMSYAAEKILKMPFSCDVEITKAWYQE